MNLKAFFYLLLRDGITSGKLELILREIEKVGSKEVLYSNKHLEAYAEDLASQFEGPSES